MYSDSEKKMWQNPVKEIVINTDISKINDKYEKGEQRIVTETTREKLPNVRGHNYSPGKM